MPNAKARRNNNSKNKRNNNDGRHEKYPNSNSSRSTWRNSKQQNRSTRGHNGNGGGGDYNTDRSSKERAANADDDNGRGEAAKQEGERQIEERRRQLKEIYQKGISASGPIMSDDEENETVRQQIAEADALLRGLRDYDDDATPGERGEIAQRSPPAAEEIDTAPRDKTRDDPEETSSSPREKTTSRNPDPGTGKNGLKDRDETTSSREKTTSPNPDPATGRKSRPKDRDETTSSQEKTSSPPEPHPGKKRPKEQLKKQPIPEDPDKSNLQPNESPKQETKKTAAADKTESLGRDLKKILENLSDQSQEPDLSERDRLVARMKKKASENQNPAPSTPSTSSLRADLGDNNNTNSSSSEGASSSEMDMEESSYQILMRLVETCNGDTLARLYLTVKLMNKRIREEPQMAPLWRNILEEIMLKMMRNRQPNNADEDNNNQMDDDGGGDGGAKEEEEESRSGDADFQESPCNYKESSKSANSPQRAITSPRNNSEDVQDQNVKMRETCLVEQHQQDEPQSGEEDEEEVPITTEKEQGGGIEQDGGEEPMDLEEQEQEEEEEFFYRNSVWPHPELDAGDSVPSPVVGPGENSSQQLSPSTLFHYLSNFIAGSGLSPITVNRGTYNCWTDQSGSSTTTPIHHVYNCTDGSGSSTPITFQQQQLHAQTTGAPDLVNWPMQGSEVFTNGDSINACLRRHGLVLPGYGSTGEISGGSGIHTAPPLRPTGSIFLRLGDRRNPILSDDQIHREEPALELQDEEEEETIGGMRRQIKIVLDDLWSWRNSSSQAPKVTNGDSEKHDQFIRLKYTEGGSPSSGSGSDSGTDEVHAHGDVGVGGVAQSTRIIIGGYHQSELAGEWPHCRPSVTRKPPQSKRRHPRISGPSNEHWGGEEISQPSYNGRQADSNLLLKMKNPRNRGRGRGNRGNNNRNRGLQRSMTTATTPKTTPAPTSKRRKLSTKDLRHLVPPPPAIQQNVGPESFDLRAILSTRRKNPGEILYNGDQQADVLPMDDLRNKILKGRESAMDDSPLGAGGGVGAASANTEQAMVGIYVDGETSGIIGDGGSLYIPDQSITSPNTNNRYNPYHHGRGGVKKRRSRKGNNNTIGNAETLEVIVPNRYGGDVLHVGY